MREIERARQTERSSGLLFVFQGSILNLHIPHRCCLCALRLLDTRRCGGKGYAYSKGDRVERAAIRSASVFWDCRIKYAN